MILYVELLYITLKKIKILDKHYNGWKSGFYSVPRLSLSLALDGRGQPLPGIFRGYPLISPKTGRQKQEMQQTLHLHVVLPEVKTCCNKKENLDFFY